jgi:hypothetical protein
MKLAPLDLERNEEETTVLYPAGSETLAELLSLLHQ